MNWEERKKKYLAELRDLIREHNFNLLIEINEHPYFFDPTVLNLTKLFIGLIAKRIWQVNDRGLRCYLAHEMAYHRCLDNTRALVTCNGTNNSTADVDKGHLTVSVAVYAYGHTLMFHLTAQPTCK